MIDNFHLLRPYWLLALVPLLILCWQLWYQKFQSRSWQAVCDPRLLPHILIGSSGHQRKWPVLLMAFTGILTIIALAGPVWKQLELPVFREQSALVIVLDLSKSMDATDLKPTRLTRARHKVIDILKQRREGQTALLVYANDAFVVSPLTQDADTMVSLVKTLSTDLMPVQGSQPQIALDKAVQLLSQAGVHSGHILLITDGIHAPQTKRLARIATENHHTLSILGAGTERGAPISMPDGGFLKDISGAIVIPKLHQNELRQLALSSGGRYHILTTNDKDLAYIMKALKTQKIDADLEKTEFLSDQWQEEGPLLLLLILPFAALAFRRGYLAVLIICCLPILPEPANAAKWDHLWKRPDQQASEILRQPKSEVNNPSPEIFKEPEWKAAAHYRAGEYEKTIEVLQGVDNADALYNTGNALAKMDRLQDAIKAYDSVLKKNPDHEDAKYNREQVKKKLKEQEKSNEQQKNEQSQESTDENKQGDDQENSQSGESQQDNQQKSEQGKDKEQTNADENSSDQNQQSNEKTQSDNDQQQANSNQKNDEDSNDKDMNQSEQSRQTDKEMAQKKLEEQEQQRQESSLAESALNEEEKTETELANEQWLRRIPDDPGGLLRRKFQYEHQRRLQQQQANGQRNNNSNGQQAW